MMICFFSKVLRLYGEDYADYSGDVAPCSLLAIYRHPFFIVLVRFFDVLSQMEFKRWTFVGVRFEVIIAVTNKLMALLHAKPRDLVNT